jgi:hypothetical protein
VSKESGSRVNAERQLVSPHRKAQEKSLDKHHRMWYNIGGKKAESPVARSMGMARGSMVETFTGFQSIKRSTYLDN